MYAPPKITEIDNGYLIEGMVDENYCMCSAFYLTLEEAQEALNNYFENTNHL